MASGDVLYQTTNGLAVQVAGSGAGLGDSGAEGSSSGWFLQMQGADQNGHYAILGEWSGVAGLQVSGSLPSGFDATKKYDIKITEH